MDQEKRIIELEKRVAFQDQTIEELNQAVLDLQKTIENTTKEVNVLKMQNSNEELVRKLEDEEPPPHY